LNVKQADVLGLNSAEHGTPVIAARPPSRHGLMRALAIVAKWSPPPRMGYSEPAK
jgi:hypothetical protein